MADNDAEPRMLRVTGLWASDTKDGQGRLLSGSIGPTLRLVILPNRQKAKPADPDYIAYYAVNERQTDAKPQQQALADNAWAL